MPLARGWERVPQEGYGIYSGILRGHFLNRPKLGSYLDPRSGGNTSAADLEGDPKIHPRGSENDPAEKRKMAPRGWAKRDSPYHFPHPVSGSFFDPHKSFSERTF